MPDPIATPHDHFFRAVFGQPPLAAAFLGQFLPAALTAPLDLATLTHRPGSFVDDDLRARHSDLLFQVRLRGGGTGLVYVLFEHKSRSERRVAVQLLRYVVRIWERDARPRARERGGAEPRIILPLVVYHGQRPWTAPRSLGELYAGPEALRPYWPELRYVLVDLSAMPEEAIVGEARLRVALLVMRSIFDPGLGRRLPAILAQLRDEQTALGILRVVMQYIVQANEHVTEDEVAEALRAVEPEMGGGTMPTLAEKWVEQGRVEGLSQGLSQGRAEGRSLGQVDGLREAIADELGERFGAAGRDLVAEVRTVTDARALRGMLRAVMRAESIDEARRALRGG